MSTNNFTKDAERIFDMLDNEAESIWQCIEEDTLPDDDDELYQYFDEGQFNDVQWINDNCLEANAHDILLATGGPAYGVSLVSGIPVYWYQDWFTKKVLRQVGSVEFYEYIFSTLEELGV